MPRLSVLPLAHMLMKAARRPPRLLQAVAARSWEISPGMVTRTPSAYFLPGQIERITGWQFSGDDPRPALRGWDDAHGPTRGFLLKDVHVIDGVVYKRDASLHISPRTRRLPPQLDVAQVFDRAALFATPGGHQYFGMWLIDDCVTYALALGEGAPLTTERKVGKHAVDYERWLGHAPLRVQSGFFRELVIFEDFSHTRSKHERFRENARKLTAHVQARPHPGVFLLRGGAGSRRLLHDELELAQALHERRGITVIDPMQADVAAIVAACAGAAVVIGVEGSQLTHGLAVMPEGSALLALQPPNRFCSLYKALTDRDGQHFAFVVGTRSADDDFSIDLQEVERTLDLLPAAP